MKTLITEKTYQAPTSEDFALIVAHAKALTSIYPNLEYIVSTSNNHTYESVLVALSEAGSNYIYLHWDNTSMHHNTGSVLNVDDLIAFMDSAAAYMQQRAKIYKITCINTGNFIGKLQQDDPLLNAINLNKFNVEAV